MFRALLANLQEVLHKRHLVCCVRVMSVGCIRFGMFHSNPGGAKRHLLTLDTFIDTRRTLTPSAIPNSNYVIMVSD
jgi:hypothetical protein